MFATSPASAASIQPNFPHSLNFGATLAKVWGRPVKVALGYGNEWGFPNRMRGTIEAWTGSR